MLAHIGVLRSRAAVPRQCRKRPENPLNRRLGHRRMRGAEPVIERSRFGMRAVGVDGGCQESLRRTALRRRPAPHVGAINIEETTETIELHQRAFSSRTGFPIVAIAAKLARAPS